MRTHRDRDIEFAVGLALNVLAIACVVAVWALGRRVKRSGYVN